METPAVGAKLEAEYKDSVKHYTGTVLAANEDGTLSVEFDDGGKDQRVPMANVKPDEATLSKREELREAREK
jgi:Na+-translocating ferredoxin:NAD+ oxidoreductase RnfG subunit